jgi:glutathione peroxidase
MTMIYDIPLKTIDVKDTSLSAYKGKVLLLVNVASKCGLTPQYEKLEALYEKYQAQGLVVLGFPANNFGAQEPGSNGEIKEFCTMNFGVKFPMFEKISVLGEDQHPLYKELVSAQKVAKTPDGESFEEKLKNYGIKRAIPSDVLWNFEKFVVNKAGEIVARFSPDMEPTHAEIISCIETLL